MWLSLLSACCNIQAESRPIPAESIITHLHNALKRDMIQHVSESFIVHLYLPQHDFTDNLCQTNEH